MIWDLLKLYQIVRVYWKFIDYLQLYGKFIDYWKFIKTISIICKFMKSASIIEIESILIIENVLKVHWLSRIEELSSKLKDA